MPNNIFLVGPMGAGKTTVGRLLAKQLRRTFYDTDQEIEKHTGATVSLIFELEKEQGFRLREKQMIDDLSQKDNIVLATGGGAVLDAGNRHTLSSRGYVIYLHSSIDQLLSRTAHDKNRPLLQTENPRQTLTELINIRDPLYREIADSVVETDQQSAHKVVSKIQTILTTTAIK